jgi:hypothetical protein
MKTSDVEFIPHADNNTFLVELGKLIGDKTDSQPVLSALPESMVPKGVAAAYGIGRLTAAKRNPAAKTVPAKKMAQKEAKTPAKKKEPLKEPEQAPAPAKAKKKEPEGKNPEPKDSPVPQKEESSWGKKKAKEPESYVMSATDQRLLDARVEIPGVSVKGDVQESRNIVLTAVGRAFCEGGEDEGKVRQILVEDLGKKDGAKVFDAVWPDRTYLHNVCQRY